MESIDEEAFYEWRKGSDVAFRNIWQILYLKCHQVAVRFAGKSIDYSLAQDIANSSFGAALEEMDLMVSGGKFLLGKLVDGRKEGLLTERMLKIRAPIDWLGETQFIHLFQRILIFRCRDKLREEAHIVNIPIDATETDMDNGNQEFQIAELSTEERDLPDFPIAAKDDIIGIVRKLSHISDQLGKLPSYREIIQGTILYIKCKIAMYSNENQLDLDEIPLSKIQSKTIEEILNNADLSFLDLDGSEWRMFLLKVLFDYREDDSEKNKKLLRNKLDQRIRRCREILKEFLNFKQLCRLIIE